MMTSVLEANDLTVGYGVIPVVTALNLSVAPGEVVALMGANGAGKSTTMMALAGILAPSAGEVRLCGERSTAPLHRRARLGLRYVSEERSVVRGLSTLDNLRLGPGPVDHALSMFPELERLLDRPAGLLSGGEQQILSLARALAGEVTVLLADELSLGLAPLIVKRLLEACRRAASERGVGVLVVEQHARQVLRYADRGYVLHRGAVVLEGSAEELQSRFDEVESSYLHGASGLDPHADIGTQDPS